MSSFRAWFAQWWPRLVAGGVVLVVLAPAAIASYLHARHVVERHDLVMGPWLPLTTDGLLAAALVVIWAKRTTTTPASRWIWAAFWTGMVATLAANLAAVLPTTPDTLLVEGIVVAVWPPITVAITLELAAILVVPAQAPAGAQSSSSPASPPAAAPVALGPAPTRQAELGSPADVPTEPPPVLARERVSLIKPSSSTPSEPDLFLQILELVERDPKIGRPRIITELGLRDNDTVRGLVRQAKDTVAARAGADR